MKKLIPVVLGSCFLLSGCLVVGPKRGKSRHGVHNHSCHPSEYWDGHKCRKKGKGHDKHKKKGKGHKKHH